MDKHGASGVGSTHCSGFKLRKRREREKRRTHRRHVVRRLVVQVLLRLGQTLEDAIVEMPVGEVSVSTGMLALGGGEARLDIGIRRDIARVFLYLLQALRKPRAVVIEEMGRTL